MLIWAGADGDGLFSSSLFAFVFETRDWSAVPFSSTSFSPGPRHFHSSVLYRDKLYIFGGKSNGYLSDLWSFDFASKTWQELDGHHSRTANKPIARFGHTAVCYEDQMIFFGGYDQHGFCCEDVPVWDFTAASADLAWKRIHTDNQSSLKLERYHHSAVTEGHSMYIFGGKNATATSSSSLCEPHLIELHIPTRQWSLVHTVGTPPSARFGHSATVVNGRLFIFGGCDGSASYSDLYSYCFVARTWEFVQVSTCPAPRYFATMSPLGDDLGSFCLMGGRDLSNYCMSDVHVFRPSTPLPVSDSPSPRHSSNLPYSPMSSSSLVPSPPSSSSSSAPPSPASSPSSPFGSSSSSSSSSSSASTNPSLSTSPPQPASSFSKRRKDGRKTRKGKGQSSRQLVVTLKCEHDGEIRVLPIQPDAITFAELLGLLSREYAQPILKVQYRDQDGDFITVRSQSDWEMLKQFLPSLVSKAANNTLKLYLSSASGAPSSPSPPLLSLRSPVQSRTSVLASKQAVAQAPVVEDVIVQWKKGPLLGRGAFGEVFLALTNTGEFLAVKQVRLPDNEDSGGDSHTQSRAVRSLRQEIQLMKDLDHPNIVRYLGTQHVDNTLNIFLEFVPGGSIATLLVKFQRFPEDVIRSFTKQILAGLTYLHEHQIIHRDIKGANLLVGVNGVIKVADFGASKKLVNLTGSFVGSHVGDGVGFKQHTIAGSPYWMAPEVIQSVPYDQRADTWSLGAAVIEMFTGAPPFSEFEPVPAMFHIASGATPKVPPASSPLAQDFLAACFIRDPSTRPSASQLLATHPFVAETEIPRRIGGAIMSSVITTTPLIFQKDPAQQQQLPVVEPVMPLSSQSFHSELLSYLQQHSSTSQSFL